VFGATDGVEIGSEKVPVGRGGILVGTEANGDASRVVVILVEGGLLRFVS
jgi:hypothetical protein